jgi:CarD family transcriptional regulator
MLKVGENGVYPAHGVVEVVGIENKEICGTEKKFYILKVIDNEVTVMVPIDNAVTVGLRPIVSKKKIPNIYSILGNKQQDYINNDGLSWNKRYRVYADKLKSGDIFEVASVLREIKLLQNGKELSFGEKRIMDSALSLLIKEISISKNQQENKVESEIRKILE